MATATRTTRTKTTDTPADTSAETSTPVKTEPVSFAPRPAAITSFRAATAKPNPLAGTVLRTKDSGPQAIDVTGPDQAKTVVGYLRRDANDSESGVRILCTDSDNKPVKEGDANVRVVNFQWKARSKRTYTTADIKAWYLVTYGEEIKGKVTPKIRAEFRTANGHDKDDKTDKNA